MKNKKFILIVVLASLCLSLTPLPYHEVTFVYDGDSILLESGERVRYLGIDTPEVDNEDGKMEFMAHEAREFNKKMLKGVHIRLEHDRKKRDRYGRLLAYVFLKNGTMLNELLVRKGLAHVMFKDKNDKYRDLLLRSQRLAMEKKLGIWGRTKKETEKVYLGNSKSFRFHRPGCSFGKKIPPQKVVRFKTRHDALWGGYSPCKHCRP